MKKNNILILTISSVFVLFMALFTFASDRTAEKESYKDWQPYKDYLRLPDSYHSR